MAKGVGWLVILIAINMLLELLAVYTADVANIITLVLVALIGIMVVAAKK